MQAVLCNLRSSFNTGAIFRTAECFGVEKIYCTGYTPGADHPGIAKTAMGTEKKICLEYAEDAINLLPKLRTRGELIALETAEKAEMLDQFCFSFPCSIIIGNEKFGLSPLLLAGVDRIVRIPLWGWKNSLNVAAALAICLYEARKQYNSIKFCNYSDFK